jgi:hypothetical protein
MEAEELEDFRAEVNRRLATMRETDGYHERHEMLYTLARKPG